ncbi:MAG: FAD-dependent monooxygenase [Deltaproteobacteria bacterium]|nr:FAD-dependent monooxygenase [Deltaproteobacteria bacterium]
MTTTTTTTRAPTIAIVGAGPAGMLLAFLLARQDIAVHVIERHADFHREFRGEGIQPSVVDLLQSLGLLDELFARKIAIRAARAEIFLDNRPALTLGDDGSARGEDFGIILHQPTFLAFIHEQLSALPHYQLSLGTTARDLAKTDGRVTGVRVTHRDKTEELIPADLVVVASGRGTALRACVNLTAVKLDSWFNVLWMLVALPEDPSLVPQGFRAYLDGDSLFIVYRTAHDMLQIAWARRDERGLRDKTHSARKEHLLRDAPQAYRAHFSNEFTEQTKTQFLRVESDRLAQWHAPGVLFIGDAAHTMSPVAGQGINLAIRDAVVAANHVVQAHHSQMPLSDELCARIQAERLPEVRAMQTLQSRLGFFMLGAKRWQTRAFFRGALPVLNALGIRRMLVRRVQHGVTQVRVQHDPPRELPAL